jgi:hypothetical protein
MSVCDGGIAPARLRGPPPCVDEYPRRSSMSGQRNGRFWEAYDAPATGWFWPTAAASLKRVRDVPVEHKSRVALDNCSA